MTQKLRRRKPLTLVDWINETGVLKVSKLLSVEQSTVRHWRCGHCLPRTDQMRAIKKLSHGRVGYDEIIDGGVQA